MTKQTRRSRREILRGALIGLSSVIGASTLTACASLPSFGPTSGQAHNGATSLTQTRAIAASTSAKPGNISLSVSIWSDVPDLGINRRIIKAFEEHHAGITVTPQQWTKNYYGQMQTALASGKEPDILYFQGWMWQPYADRGQIRNLDSYIARDRHQLAGDLFPHLDAYIRQLTMRGKRFGLPVDTGSMVLFYNTQLFQEIGVPFPQPHWTYEGWLATVRQVSEGLRRAGKMNVYAYQPNYGDEYVRNFPWWRMQGAVEFDQLELPKRAYWDDARIASAWQLELHDLASQGLAISRSALLKAGGPNAFYTYGIQHGVTVMKVEGPWFLPQMWGPQAPTKGGIPFDVVRLPRGSKGYSEFWQVDPLTITANTAHTDASWAYVKFAASPAGQQHVAEGGRMTNTPASIVQQWAPIVQKLYHFQHAREFAFAQGASIVATGNVDVNQLESKGGLWAARDAVILGKETAKEALATAQTKCQTLLDRWWQSHPNG